MDAKVDSPTRRAAAVAKAQYGVLTSAQLFECGVTRDAVRRSVEAGRLFRVHRGVYAMGHPGISREGRWMAAVLASGRGAVLSHGAAAAHWGLLRPLSGPVDVSVPTQAGRVKRAGIRLHRREALGPTDLTHHQGIPVTTPARTVADLPGAISPRLVRRARRQAELAGYRLDAPRKRIRSDLEEDFLAFLRRHRLPRPEVNVKLGRYEVDFLWRPQRLVVETDFYAYHRGATAFEDDHRRDLQLRRLGFAVHRYTGAQLRRYSTEIAAELGEILR